MSKIKGILCILVLLVFSTTALASESMVVNVNTIYRSEEKFGVSDNEMLNSSSEEYKDTIGKLVISAEDLNAISEKELDTYIIKSGYSAQFSYDSIKDLTKPIKLDVWGLEDDGISRIGDFDWKKGVGKGGVLVQKSYDRENWETVFTDTNVFKDYSETIKNFYSATRADLNQGCYYRIVIAYRKAKKLTDTSFIGIFDTSEYKRAFCVEVYNIYLASTDETDAISVSIEGQNNADLGEDAAKYGSGAVASQSIANQVAGQEILATAPGKAGYGGEAANIQNQTIQSIGSGDKVIHTGANNAPNGPDYIIASKNGDIIESVQIQTKYYSTAGQSISACFDQESGMFRYNIEPGKPMQIEVPKDQYDKAIALMKDKIIGGYVEGITDPAEAENIIRKGSVTYKQAANIAKAGNIDSLIYDAKNGIITSTVAMGISSVIQFAACIWNPCLQALKH